MDTTSKPVAADAVDPVPAAPAATEGRAHTAASEELDKLFEFLVQQAHSAVDRLAERAAPALGPLGSGLAIAGELTGRRSGTDDDGGILPGVANLPASAEELAEQYYELVRKHPVASLAAAVAAGIVLGQIRAR
jgi:hypothetical protein